MKVGDLIRWTLKEYEIGVIAGVNGNIGSAPLYRVFCLADGCFYYANPKEIEVINEDR